MGFLDWIGNILEREKLVDTATGRLFQRFTSGSRSVLVEESTASVELWNSLAPVCHLRWGRCENHMTISGSSGIVRSSRSVPYSSMVQYPKDCTWPIKPEYEYRFIQYLVIKKIASKSPVNCRLTPCFRRHIAIFGDSSQVRAWCSIVQMNGWNITQRAASLCDVIMGSVTSSMHSHDKTNEHTLSYRCANNAIERC